MFTSLTLCSQIRFPKIPPKRIRITKSNLYNLQVVWRTVLVCTSSTEEEHRGPTARQVQRAAFHLLVTRQRQCWSYLIRSTQRRSRMHITWSPIRTAAAENIPAKCVRRWVTIIFVYIATRFVVVQTANSPIPTASRRRQKYTFDCNLRERLPTMFMRRKTTPMKLIKRTYLYY